MIISVKYIYDSQDLNNNFEFLCTPLKAYDNFFSEQVKKNTGFQKLALQVVYLVSAFFVYPVLAPIAAIGVCLKLTDFESLKIHNQATIIDVQATKSLVKIERTPAKYSAPLFHLNQLQLVKAVHITKHNVDSQCVALIQEIHLTTQRFKKAYLNTLGYIDEGKGAITVQLLTKV